MIGINDRERKNGDGKETKLDKIGESSQVLNLNHEMYKTVYICKYIYISIRELCFRTRVFLSLFDDVFDAITPRPRCVHQESRFTRLI